MRLTVSIPAAIALAAFIYTPSLANCPDVTGSVTKDGHSGIVQDGTHVPLEGNSGTQVKTETATGTTTTSADALAKTPQKDGGKMPMAANPDIATSSQDAIAQQKGGKTAAATAEEGKCD